MFMKSFLFAVWYFSLQFASVMTDYLSSYKHFTDTVGAKADKLVDQISVSLCYGLEHGRPDFVCLKRNICSPSFYSDEWFDRYRKKDNTEKISGEKKYTNKKTKKTRNRVNHREFVIIMTQTFHTTRSWLEMYLDALFLSHTLISRLFWPVDPVRPELSEHLDHLLICLQNPAIQFLKRGNKTPRPHISIFHWPDVSLTLSRLIICSARC